MNRQSLTLLISILIGSVLLAACAEPARRPDKVKTATATPPAAERPGWVDGEFETEKMFWGTGWAAITDGNETAQQAATDSANTNLAAELQLLVTALSTDHEEQVAEVISRYPMEDFNSHMAGAKAATVTQTKVVDTFIDRTRQPNRIHVLVQVTPAQFFKEVENRQDLPAEQKNRIKDYGNVFLDGVMENLGR